MKKMIAVILILLAVCIIGIVVYCCAAGTTPYGRQADDDAQMEYLHRDTESRE